MRTATRFTILLLSVLVATSAWGGWIPDGIAISATSGDQINNQIVSDGSGRIFVAWQDYRSGNDDIYAQRLDKYGSVMWTANGVAICAASGDQQYPQLVSDGSGGAIIAWSDQRSGAYVYAQRIDMNGSVLWATNGVAICTSGLAESPQLASDGSGGAIISWADYRNSNYDIYAQRVNANGMVLWTANGVNISTRSGNQKNPQLIPDGAGGGIVTYEDGSSGSQNIYAQRVDANGSVLWTAGGSVVCAATGSQVYPRLASDGSGGAIITWFDMRAGGGNWDIYAQKVDSNGAGLWTSDGVAICTLSGAQSYPRIAPDGSSGAFIVWLDQRAVQYVNDVYAQRIDSNGSALWTVNGVAICTVSGTKYDARIATDGSGGASIVWQDQRTAPDHHIYAQGVHGDGSLTGPNGGVPICTANGGQGILEAAPDGSSGVVAAWADYRGGNYDIYAARFDENGYWGYPSAYITDITDVAADQGGYVDVAWEASRLDTISSSPILYYSIYGRGTGPWSWIGDVPSAHVPSYTYRAPTPTDSMGGDLHYTHYYIDARTAESSVYWTSPVDSGYSVDNLAPGLTTGFAGAEIESPAGLALTWSPNIAPDIENYHVYRGADEFFVPAAGNMIGSTADTALFDGSWVHANHYFYKLVAVDRHGNAGLAALLRPEDVKVGTMLQSFAASLSGPFVEITWRVSEAGADVRFVALRSEAQGGAFEELAAPQIDRDGLSFSMSDRSCEPGTSYRYRIDVADETGRRTLFETDAISTPALPLTLYQNHPNPFNPSTAISYYVPVAGPVTLDVYDSSGRLVVRLANSEKQAKGTHSVEWQGLDASGRTVSSGVYFYRLTSGKETISKKMVLLR